MPFLLLDVFAFQLAFNIPEGKARPERSFVYRPASCENMSVLLTFRNGPARQTDLGEYRLVIAKGLVHIWNDLDDLAEQRPFAVIHDLGHEVRADRLP